MPLNSTRGAGSAKGFGFTAGAALVEVDYLLVAGGGGGGTWWGGAGAGGYRASTGGPAPLNSGTKITLKKGTSPITVGGGGVGQPGAYILCGGPAATSGTPSIIGTTFTATGGGHATTYLAVTGGSGGGDYPGGDGNTPPVSPPQGNPAGVRGSFPGYGGGGGGGAGGAGSNGSPSAGAGGGVGVNNDINGTSTAYAGGGGGGGSIPAGGSPGGPGSPCGTGGAGSGNAPGGNGSNNRGGGGGSGGYAPGQPGGSGGSGIVIVRAPSAVTFSVSPGTNSTSTTPGGCKVATFTVSGNLTIS